MGVTQATEFVDAVETLMGVASTDMLTHRNDVYPQEAVGILCSDGSSYPLVNQARSPHRFEVSSPLVSEAVSMLNDVGKFPVAVYHSHPDSASGPSTRDISFMQAMKGAVSVIIGIDGISGWLWDVDENRLMSVGYVSLPDKG